MFLGLIKSFKKTQQKGEKIGQTGGGVVKVRKSEIITDYYPCNLWTTRPKLLFDQNWQFATFY